MFRARGARRRAAAGCCWAGNVLTFYRPFRLARWIGQITMNHAAPPARYRSRAALPSRKPHVAPSPWHVSRCDRRRCWTLLTSPPDAVHVAAALPGRPGGRCSAPLGASKVKAPSSAASRSPQRQHAFVRAQHTT